MSLEVNIINLRMSHHAGPSGYDRIAQGLQANPIIPDMRNIPIRIASKLLSPLISGSGSLWYNRVSMCSEFYAANAWLRNNNQLFHFLYGENSYRYFGNIRSLWNRQNKLLCTFHTPIWRLREVVQCEKHYRYLDAVVIMSNSQRDYFVEQLDSDRVFFVPHGVDTDYFSPRQELRLSDPPGLRFVTVGYHLRDFEVLAKIASALERYHPTARIDLVARPDRVGLLEGRPNVRCLSGISDAELLELYQTSDVLLLPLVDATANNSLLEGMACGLPVVSTDLPGVRDYVSDGCSLLSPIKDADAHINAVLDICEGRVELSSMARASREKAEEFDWPRVSAMLEAVYLTL